MQQLAGSMTLILTRKDSRAVIIATTFLLLLLLLLLTNGKTAFEALSFDILSLPERLQLFFSTFFDLRNTFDAGSLALAVLGAILGGINVSLAYTYIRLRGELIIQSGLYSGTGLFLAFLGIGCAACGTAFLSVFLSLFGFSSMLQLLPYQGMEIGYIGLIILSIATYYLAKRVSTPGVC